MGLEEKYIDACFFQEDHIKSLYQKYENELNTDTMMAMKKDRLGNPDGGISRVDGEIVYMLIREMGIRHAIEFSPNEGYSTGFTYSALKKNHETFTFATFDMELSPFFVDRMHQFNMTVSFGKGDALENIPKYLEANDLIGKIEFCFIDSDHSYRFAERYCRDLMPLMSEQCVYFIHDLCYRPYDFQNFSHYGRILPLEIGGTLSALGEGSYLCEYFLSHHPNHVIFSTHKLFGDHHEYSSILPRNLALIQELTTMIKGFQLPPSAGQKGGMPRPPMGIIVIPKTLFGRTP